MSLIMMNCLTKFFLQLKTLEMWNDKVIKILICKMLDLPLKTLSFLLYLAKPVYCFCSLYKHVNFCILQFYLCYTVVITITHIYCRINILHGHFSHSVMSDSLRAHELQHARPPCPSATARVYPNPCSLRRWCHPTISSSVIPFSSCPQSLPASGSFQIRQLFASGVQSIGVSASTSVLSMNTQDSSPLGWTGWISLQSKGLSRVFSNTAVQKHQFFGAQLSSQSNSHIHTWLLEEP